jgi:serine/threonine protein phosphatase PrpC
MGATLVAVVVHRALAHIACVGDSRVYLIRENAIHQLTKDQSYVEVLIEAGVISREQAMTSPYRNVILQAMGKAESVRVALVRVAMRRGDVFLLCSDGLSNKVTDEEMRELVALGPSLETVCSRLIALANERGGEDNITVALAEVAGLDVATVSPAESVEETIVVVDPEPPITG